MIFSTTTKASCFLLVMVATAHVVANAQETQQQCLDSCYTSFSACCGMTQTDEVVTVQYDDFWGNCDDANLYEKCTGEQINCRGACPPADDEATTNDIAEVGNDKEGATGLRGHHHIITKPVEVAEDAFVTNPSSLTVAFNKKIDHLTIAIVQDKELCLDNCQNTWGTCCRTYNCQYRDVYYKCDKEYNTCAGMCANPTASPSASPAIHTPPPAPRTQRQQCLDDCDTAYYICCGTSQCKGPDDQMLHYKCYGVEYRNCEFDCPRTEDEATTKVIANFDNENEGTLQHTTD